jgi:hypothetical protein
MVANISVKTKKYKFRVGKTSSAIGVKADYVTFVKNDMRCVTKTVAWDRRLFGTHPCKFVNGELQVVPTFDATQRGIYYDFNELLYLGEITYEVDTHNVLNVDVYIPVGVDNQQKVIITNKVNTTLGQQMLQTLVHKACLD